MQVFDRSIKTRSIVSGSIRTGPYFVFVSWICWTIHETKTKYSLVWIGPLFDNRAPQRQAVGTFDVCLTRPKVCPTDTVRPHSAQLMIDTSVNQFCKIWSSAAWPILTEIFVQFKILGTTRHFLHTPRSIKVQTRHVGLPVPSLGTGGYLWVSDPARLHSQWISATWRQIIVNKTKRNSVINALGLGTQDCELSPGRTTNKCPKIICSANILNVRKGRWGELLGKAQCYGVNNHNKSNQIIIIII